jgi:hypothetical protein
MSGIRLFSSVAKKADRLKAGQHAVNWILSTLVILFVGCAGYRVGPVNGVSARSRAVTVNLFQNNTYEPRLSESVAFALRRRLQQDGTYRLDTQNEGDIVVSGAITRYDRAPLSFDPRDVLTPRDYTLSITADVTAAERGTGKVIFQRAFQGRTVVRATADRNAAERQAHPTMADDLARNITSALTEGPW